MNDFLLSYVSFHLLRLVRCSLILGNLAAGNHNPLLKQYFGHHSFVLMA